MDLDRRFLHMLYAAVFIAVALAYLLAAHPVWGAAGDTGKPAAKAYTPFDEPMPRIPKEFADDKRLEQRVKVFCKSKNVKDLLADLSAKTGVKVSAAKEVSSQRVIIYFHDRPLSDVLTEISAIYGYHWLVSGKSGAYEYQLFDDIVRAKRRDRAPGELKAEQDGLLLDFADGLLGQDRDKVLDRLAKENPEAHKALTSESQESLQRILGGLGMDFLSGVLANGSSTQRCGDLPLALQQAVCDYYNQRAAAAPSAAIAQSLAAQGIETHTPPNAGPCSAADLADAMVQVERSESDPSGTPRFSLQVTRLDGPGRLSFNMEWPSRSVTADDMRRATDREVPDKVINDSELPVEPKITVSKLRWLPNRKGLLLGDLLEGIAIQSGKDIIADYYLQDKSVGAVTAEPLKQAVETVCRQFDYTCQVDSRTLRLRHNKWFMQEMHAEPPSQVVENLWARIIENGTVTVRDLSPVASLSADHLKWPGWRFIPGTDSACQRPQAVGLLDSLSEGQEKTARDGGLAVSELTKDQRRKLDGFIAEQHAGGVSEEGVSNGTIAVSTAKPQVVSGDGTKIITYGNPGPTGGAQPNSAPTTPNRKIPPGGRRVVTMKGNPGSGITLGGLSGDALAGFARISNSVNETISLVLTDPVRSIPASLLIPMPVSEAERKEIADQLKADREADSVELLQ